MLKFKNCYGLLIILFFSIQHINAQTQRSINISIGYGITSPYDETDVEGSGFYAQGEYIFHLKNWVDIRPYAGLIITNDPSNDIYETSSKAFLLGGKGRITAPMPFPWIAPYFELGIGTSIGEFRTYTPLTDLSQQGVILHIPFSIGVEIGSKRKFDLGFTYYYQPAVEQFSGAIAFGVSFPIKNSAL